MSNSLKTAWATLRTGLALTFRHILSARRGRKKSWVDTPGYFLDQKGTATVQYPHEVVPVPETGRYKLHNEIDDCIVCDKCAKICPVDCITIEPIKSPVELGKTSDGTPKRIYAAKFDIDLGICCFCGLCTTVCPTECLTMTPDYDYSSFNISEHNVSFATMGPDEIVTRRKEWETHATSKTSDSQTGVNPAGES